MKTLAKVFFFSTLSLSSFATAADYREAASICEGVLNFSVQNTCVSIINSAKSEYFDSSAIQVCKDMVVDGEAVRCIQNIKGKSYEPYEISNCTNDLQDSALNDCLANAGTRIPSPSENSSLGDFVSGPIANWEQYGFASPMSGEIKTYTLTFQKNYGVAQVRIATVNSPARITRAYMVTLSGEHIELPGFVGDMPADGSKIRTLNSKYAVRLRELVFYVANPYSSNSQGQFDLMIGLTQN